MFMVNKHEIWVKKWIMGLFKTTLLINNELFIA